jgi:hypothetical protein
MYKIKNGGGVLISHGLVQRLIIKVALFISVNVVIVTVFVEELFVFCGFVEGHEILVVATVEISLPFFLHFDG